MKIVSIRGSYPLSDGKIRKEYRLSSPVTSEVLTALSKGDYVCTGRQYLSPTYSITKADGVKISGILRSPIIVVQYTPGMSVGIEDYLSGFLSTITDSEDPESIIKMFLHSVIITLWNLRFNN